MGVRESPTPTQTRNDGSINTQAPARYNPTHPVEYIAARADPELEHAAPTTERFCEEYRYIRIYHQGKTFNLVRPRTPRR